MNKCKVYEEELGIGGLLSCGWRVTKNNMPFLLTMGLVFYFPVSLLEAYAEFDDDFRAAALLLYWFVDTFVILGVIIKTKRSIDGESTDNKYIFITAFRLVPRTVIASVIAAVIVILLAFLLIVPGIIWAVYYTFLFNAIALSYEKGKGALDYSKALVSGRWFEVFGVTLLIAVISVLIALIISIPFAPLSVYLPSGEIIFTAVSYTIIYTFSLFYFITMTVYFLNLEHLSAKAEKPVEVHGYLREGLDGLTDVPEES